MEEKTQPILLLISIAVLLVLLVVIELTTQAQNERILEQANAIVDEFDEISTSYRFMEYLLEKNTACQIVTRQAQQLENRLWNLGNNIEQQRQQNKNEDYDEFYLNGKRRVNRWEAMHLSMVAKLKQHCNYSETNILYFYGECGKNRLCTQQGHELDAIRSRFGEAVSVYSFDMDLNSTVTQTLSTAYNITSLPCIVIEDAAYCRYLDTQQLSQLLCEANPAHVECVKS